MAEKKQRRGTRFAWFACLVFAIVAILSFLSVALTTSTGEPFHKIGIPTNLVFLNAITLLPPLGAFVSFLLVRLCTCGVKKATKMYRVNVVSMVVMLVVYLLLLGLFVPSFVPMMLKHMAEAKENAVYAFEHGFMLLFGGKCDWLSWAHLASPLVLLVGYVLMYSLMVRDAKEVRAEIKTVKTAKRKEKKLRLEEERKARQAKQEEKRAAFLAKQEEERKLRQEEQERKAQEKEKLIAEKKSKKEAKEQELARKKTEEAEAKIAALERKEKEANQICVPSEQEETPKNYVEAKDSSKLKDNLKAVYVSFLSVSLPVFLLQLLSVPGFMTYEPVPGFMTYAGFMAYEYAWVFESEYSILSILAAAIYLIFNLIFIILAAVNPRKANLSLRVLLFSSLGVQTIWSGLGVLICGLIHNQIFFVTLPIDLLLLVASIVLLCVYKKRSRIKTYICFGSLAILMVFELILNFLPQYTFLIIKNPRGATSIIVAVIWSMAAFALVFFSKKLSEGYLLSESLPKKIKAQKEEERFKIKADGKSSFDGKLIQLIGYHLLGYIITGVTFGFGYPWAKCFVERWTVKHQTIDDERLAFNGNGAQLFGKYILWIVLTIVTFGIYGLWLTIKMKKWTVSHTHIKESNKAVEAKSVFDGKLIQLIGYNVLALLITVFSFGIAYPWAACLKLNWESKHTIVDGKRLCFNGNGAQLFGKYILWIVLTIVTFGIYGLWLTIKMKKWTVSHTHFQIGPLEKEELQEEIKPALEEKQN